MIVSGTAVIRAENQGETISYLRNVVQDAINVKIPWICWCSLCFLYVMWIFVNKNQTKNSNLIQKYSELNLFYSNPKKWNVFLSSRASFDVNLTMNSVQGTIFSNLNDDLGLVSSMKLPIFEVIPYGYGLVC